MDPYLRKDIEDEINSYWFSQHMKIYKSCVDMIPLKHSEYMVRIFIRNDLLEYLEMMRSRTGR